MKFSFDFLLISYVYFILEIYLGIWAFYFSYVDRGFGIFKFGIGWTSRSRLFDFFSSDGC